LANRLSEIKNNAIIFLCSGNFYLKNETGCVLEIILWYITGFGMIVIDISQYKNDKTS